MSQTGHTKSIGLASVHAVLAQSFFQFFLVALILLCCYNVGVIEQTHCSGVEEGTSVVLVEWHRPWFQVKCSAGLLAVVKVVLCPSVVWG